MDDTIKCVRIYPGGRAEVVTNRQYRDYMEITGDYDLAMKKLLQGHRIFVAPDIYAKVILNLNEFLRSNNPND